MTTATPTDPYEILGLSSTATVEQVRRSYKRLCLRWHPDKHPDGAQRADAERRFKAIVRAYSDICEATTTTNSSSDPENDPFSDPLYQRSFARSFADHLGAEGVPVDTDSLFQSLFGDRHDSTTDSSNLNQPSSTNSKSSQPKPSDREVDLPLTLEELYTGCIKKRRMRPPPNAPTGTNSPVLNISVRPGYRPGDRVRFRDAAFDTPNAPPADVVFTITQKPHPHFKVDGDDLRIMMRVNLVDALAGAVLIVRTLDSSEIKIPIDSVIYPDYVHCVKGKGMPRRSSPNQYGDLFISFQIQFPRRVEADDRSAVRDLFSRLDSHSKNRMSMRRSSSLFTTRQQAANILHPRRSSTSRSSNAHHYHYNKSDTNQKQKGKHSSSGSTSSPESNIEECTKSEINLRNNSQDDTASEGQASTNSHNSSSGNKSKSNWGMLKLSSIFR